MEARVIYGLSGACPKFVRDLIMQSLLQILACINLPHLGAESNGWVNRDVLGLRHSLKVQGLRFGFGS